MDANEIQSMTLGDLKVFAGKHRNELIVFGVMGFIIMLQRRKIRLLEALS